MQSMCISVVYYIMKVILVGVKTLPAGVPCTVMVVMECPSFVVVKCLSKVTPVGVKTLPAGVPDRFLVCGHGVSMQSMCVAVVYCRMKVILEV